MTISNFRNEFAFLSNFQRCRVEFLGLMYDNAEAAFQSQKCPSRAGEFVGLSPTEAKKLGRRVNLRGDWDEVKDGIMYEIVLAKFEQNPALREQLFNTGGGELIEGNTWNDHYWGVCKGVGKNMLGKILMRVRDELRDKYEPRVADDCVVNTKARETTEYRLTQDTCDRLVRILEEGEGTLLHSTYTKKFGLRRLSIYEDETELDLVEIAGRCVMIETISLRNRHRGTFTKLVELLKDDVYQANKSGAAVMYIEIVSVITPEMVAWCKKNGFQQRADHTYDKEGMGGSYFWNFE